MFLIVWVIFLSSTTESFADDSLLVSLDDGLIRGTYKRSYDGRKYLAFVGVPYAKPPIQELRFEDPVPVEPWFDILEVKTSYTCLQLGLTSGSELKEMGQEDCLYLNVFVPREKVNATENLDVVVYIHGGAFVIGSPSSLGEPTKIMDRDVVYVSITYRLGPFGFFNIGDGRGNYGLKDQTAALRWIQKNIEKFGGNKNSVTIAGFSAGGASVQFHYLSNLSKGLFHKGFAQSGVALNPWAWKKNYTNNAKMLSEGVGCPTDIIEDVYKCLKRRSAGQINKAIGLLYQAPFLPLTVFGPVVEKDSPTSFLVESPYQQLLKKKVMNVPLLISMVTNEGTVPCSTMYGKFDDLNRDWAKWAPLLLEYYTYDQKKQDEISEKVRKEYFNDQSISKDNFHLVIRACSHRNFHIGGEEAVRLQAEISDSNVHFLFMNYSGEFRPLNISGFDMNIVHHGVDTKFYTDGSFIQTWVLNKEEERMKDILLDMLASFAKTGVPKIKSVDFEPISKSGAFKYIFINGPDDITLKTEETLVPASRFWESLALNKID